MIDHSVGVSGRGDELDPESAHVEDDGPQDVQVGLGRVVPSGADLAELEGAAEESEHLRLQGPGELEVSPAPDDQVLTSPGGEPVILGEADCALRTCLDALGAEEATAEVESKAPVVAGDRVGGARLGARPAPVGAPRLVQHGQAAEAVGERRAARRPDRRSSVGLAGVAPG